MREREGRVRLLLAAGLAAAAGLLPVPPLAGPAAAGPAVVSQDISYEVVSIDGRRRPLSLDWLVRSSERGSMITDIGVSGRGPTTRWWDALFTATEDEQGSLRKLPVGLPPCSDVVKPVCGVLAGWRDLLVSIRSTDSASTRWYLNATTVDSSSVVSVSSGWKVRRIPPLRVAQWRPLEHGQRLAIPKVSPTLTHFTGGSTTGGPYGSLTFVWLPCSPTEGVGSAVLTGGAQPQTFECAGNYADFPVFTLRPTTWRLQGHVLGTGNFPSVITTISLPK